LLLLLGYLLGDIPRKNDHPVRFALGEFCRRENRDMASGHEFALL
jgi:hypothetical protein